MQTMELLLIAVLAVSNTIVPAITVYAATRWRKKAEEQMAEIRREHVGRLHKAEQQYLIARHELILDSKALQLASMELMNVVDDADNPILGDTWKRVRDNLRQMARDHDIEKIDDELLKRAYRVTIVNEGDAG